MPKKGKLRPRKPIVRMERKGNILLIPRVSRRILSIVRQQLTYSYRQYTRGGRGRGRSTGGGMKIIPTECFSEIKDPEKILPPQIMTCAGYRFRLMKVFRRAGYIVKYTDNTPERKGRAHKVIWDRLDPRACRYRQEECIRKILTSECGRVRCPTGYGKSWIIGKLAQMLPYAQIDVTTHSNDVIEMIYKDLSRELPSVGLVTGSKKEYGHRVMCYSGKSLHRSDWKADYLFVDEVHEFATDDYLNKVTKYKRSRNFGFSANAIGDRPDGADFELEGIFGPELMQVGYSEAVDHGSVVQLKVIWVDVIMDANPAADARDSVQKMRWGVWRNPIRNEKIANISRHFFNDGRQVLIMVDTIDHACHLKQLLPEFEMVYAEGNLLGDDRDKFVRWRMINFDEPIMTADRRMELKKRFESGELRGAIATGVWSRGVNFKHLNVLVRADAKTSPIADTQLPGRLSRIDEDKEYALLVDFKDQFDASLKRRATERRRRYEANHWDQFEDKDKAGGKFRQQTLLMD